MSILGNVVTGDVNYDAGSEAAATISRQGRLRVDGGPGTGGSLTGGTNRSGAIDAGGTAQQLAPANSARIALKGQNISSADIWINEVTGNATAAAPNAVGSYKIVAGGTFSVQTNKLISVYGATTGQAWTATET